MKYREKPVCTIALIALNVIVFFWLSFGGITEDAFYMLEHGAMYPYHFFELKEYYRILTSMFLHFGFEHLMNNMVTLYIMGMYLEPVVGRWKFSVIYVISGLGGGLLSVLAEWFANDYAISAGASGAIFGLTGALFCLTILNRGQISGLTKQNMLVMIGISLYNGFVSEGVDNMAHMGGLIFGFLAALLLCFQTYTKRRSYTWE